MGRRWNEKIRSKKEYQESIRENYWNKKCKERLSSIKMNIQKNGIRTCVENYFENHQKEYKSFWEKFSLSIGKENQSQNNEISTPELLKNASNSNVNLVNLYANFSRYLLISGSRKPGKNPYNFARALELLYGSSLGFKIYNQHKYRNELLACKYDKFE